MAIAPGLTIGFVRPSSVRSTASSELNGSPVAFTPTRSRTRSGPRASQTSAKTNGLETLMIVNSTSASPTSNTSPLVLTTEMANASAEAFASAGIDARELSVARFRGTAPNASRTRPRTRSRGGSRPVET